MNETSSKQSDYSTTAASSEQLGKAFGPPEITSLASLTDGRKPGEYKTIYPPSAWVQIGGELLYLLTILAGCMGLLAWMARVLVLGSPEAFLPDLFGPSPANAPLLVWTAAGLAGGCGGAASALKWLYHSIAKQQWHRDRVVWRIVVPPLSAVLSVFTGLMIVSGLIPFFSNASFNSPAATAAFGFFVGFFSDNLLASLQKLAFRIFGTVGNGGN